jgi:hypothetical protein
MGNQSKLQKCMSARNSIVCILLEINAASVLWRDNFYIQTSTEEFDGGKFFLVLQKSFPVKKMKGNEPEGILKVCSAKIITKV